MTASFPAKTPFTLRRFSGRIAPLYRWRPGRLSVKGVLCEPGPEWEGSAVLPECRSFERIWHNQVPRSLMVTWLQQDSGAPKAFFMLPFLISRNLVDAQVAQVPQQSFLPSEPVGYQSERTSCLHRQQVLFLYPSGCGRMEWPLLWPFYPKWPTCPKKDRKQDCDSFCIKLKRRLLHYYFCWLSHSLRTVLLWLYKHEGKS